MASLLKAAAPEVTLLTIQAGLGGAFSIFRGDLATHHWATLTTLETQTWDYLCPGRKCAAPSYSNNVGIIPSKEILELQLILSPICPVRRPVAQLFLGPICYFQWPTRRGAGGTKLGKTCCCRNIRTSKTLIRVRGPVEKHGTCSWRDLSAIGRSLVRTPWIPQSKEWVSFVKGDPNPD